MIIVNQHAVNPESNELLEINAKLTINWLVAFLKDELSRRRGFTRAVLGLSGGVDSAVTAFLCARAFGSENVYAFMMPYKLSSSASLEHAELVIKQLGVNKQIVEITSAVDGYIDLFEPDISPSRRGNICARMRMIVLFDQAAKLNALPIGTGNKTERLFGYFTWHADDSPPLNPLGDLYKTQVWEIARELGVPDVIITKPATADLISGQTDEGDFGISYAKADRILTYLLRGYSAQKLIKMGFDESEVMLVRSKVDKTHWKRHLPTTAMISSSSINDFYLRPVDY